MQDAPLNVNQIKRRNREVFSQRTNLEKHSLHSYHIADANHIYRMDYCRRASCVQIILQILENREIIWRLRHLVKSTLSQMSINSSFSDDPGKRPKPSRTRWHLPRLKKCGQIEFNGLFLQSNFPMIVAINMIKNITPVAHGGGSKLLWLILRLSVFLRTEI